MKVGYRDPGQLREVNPNGEPVSLREMWSRGRKAGQLLWSADEGNLALK
jgi:hypothetical protein